MGVETNNMRDAFFNSIKPMIKKMIKEELFRYPYSWAGTVKAVSGTIPNQTANIELDIDKGTGITRNNLRNKSGESLSVNDEVYVFAPKGQSLSNAYILTKK